MPGSSAPPPDAPPKAKVTSAATNGGIFVRPVAVAGIFCPNSDSTNKPPALPEKRRFSALSGDLRPCTSDGGPSADDFNRRRQSWDTRQKVAPFSQAILRKTPKNNATSTPKLEETKNGTGYPEFSATLDTQNSSPFNKSSVAAKTEVVHKVEHVQESSTSENQGKTQSIINNSGAKLDKSIGCSSDKSKIQDSTIKKSSLANKETENVSQAKISLPTVACVNVNSSTGVSENNIEVKNVPITEAVKQPKKVYGLIKRESKTKISEVQPDNESGSKNVSSPATSSVSTSNKIKVYGLNKAVHHKVPSSYEQEAQVQVKKESDNVAPSKNSETAFQKLPESEKVNNDQIKIGLPTKSPPKEFRTVRRTSDVIAAKIQNIFSNFQSEKPAPVTPKKAPIAEVAKPFKNIEHTEVSKSQIAEKSGEKNSKTEDSKLTVSIQKKDGEIKPTNEKSINDGCKSKIIVAAHNIDGDRAKQTFNKEKAQGNPNEGKISIQSLKVDSFRSAATSNSISSSNQKDKSVADIEGKMPIKKADENSSCSTNPSVSTINGKSDHKSSVSSASLSTSMENVNKGPGVVKKQIVAAGKNTPSQLSVVTRKNTSFTGSKDAGVEQETFQSSSHIKTTSSTSQSYSSSYINQSTYSENSRIISKKEAQETSEVSKITLNGSKESAEVSKVEVTKITPSTTPGIVPTVNVLFRTKSPQGIANREENRKKVVIETYTGDAPISSAVIIPSPSPADTSALNNAVKKTLKSVEDVPSSLNSSSTAPKTLSIVNLKKEELVTVSFSTVSKNAEPQSTSCSSIQNDVSYTTLNQDSTRPIDSKVSITPIKTITDKQNLDSKLSSMESVSLTSDLPSSLANKDDHKDVKKPELKTSVVDIDDWSKKFQRLEPEAPRAPLRRRALRDSLPPSLPSRSISRYGSLKRIEDSPRYLPRSPSQSSLPQRYSYTEMLTKVCSMGVLPFVEPINSKSCSSSSSQVSELWSELSEEQSTATHASEMLEAETSERMRLEKEVHELQSRYSQVQQRSDKMEMEMMENRMYRSPELNGDLSEDDEADGSSSIYKQKYERAVRDMEILKRRMQQQQEEEMEQKAMMKKASEKRLAEALEDIEEERQIANQWKRKAQKLGAELQDIRLMLEEQMGRNGELEKKQRKFDAELSSAQEEIKKERILREKLMREKDQAISEKYSLEQELQSTKLDADLLHEKITQLNRELDELTLSSRGEEEVTQLKRAKQELERKTRDQEEELEELAAQVSMLEQAKLRLEMSLENVRKEQRREASVREEEIEEIRASFSKKIKNLEAQLETEQDEKHQLMKQKHELERRIYELADQPPPQDPEIERRLRRDLKRTKALLRDAQSMLEHTREGQSSKTLIRQLKNQLEDSEFAKVTAVKARQAIETELQECQLQLEEITRTKNDAESRCLQLSREKSAIQTQLEEAEEEMAEVMKKYKAVVAQMSIDQKTLAEQNQQIAELETERQMLKDQLSEVSHKFEHLAGQSDDTHKVHWLDSKIRDLESKLELEQTTKSRLENQISRLKEQNDRSREECDSLRNKEMQAQEGVRRLQRQLRDLREDYTMLQQKEADAYRKQHELEMALENTETDLQVTKNDLRLACQRIQDLQNALEDDLDSGTDVPDDSGSDSDDSYELSVLRNTSITPVQRCDSVASNLSYCTTEEQRSRTSSFSRELSAFSSRDDVEKDINGFSGVNTSHGLNLENDATN